MKQMTSGMIALVGVFALASCYSYSSEAINNANYNTVQATPNFATMKVGDSDQVIVRLVNDANNGALTSYTVAGTGAGIAVHYQVGYRPVFDSKLDTLVVTGDKNAQQYFIVGVTPGLWTFTLTPTSVNTGVSTTVQALVSPDSMRGALSKTTGLNAGDTLTITAQTNTVFSQASVFTFQVGPSPALVGISADSTTARLLVAPGDSGKVSITKMNVKQSSSNASQVTLLSTTSISKVPPITLAPTTASTTTPGFGATFTLTLGNNLRFTSTSTVTLGALPAIILSRSADSTTATVVPFGGITGGLVSYTNVVLSFLNSVPLSIPGDKSITIGPLTSDPNAGSTATASTIVLPASGQTAVFSDAGPYTASAQCAHAGDACRFYKFTTTVTSTFDVDLKWDGGADMGWYRFNSTGTTAAGVADAHGEPDADESGTNTALAAGTYFAGIVYYGVPSYGAGALAAPTWFQFKVVMH